MSDSASTLIQLMLAPGLMISACGLLLLGMNNKYSLVVNRIRLLNEERRRMRYEANRVENYEQRHKSIDTQINKLIYRVSLVRNAVFSYSIAVAFFIVASLLIGYKHIMQQEEFTWMIITVFLAGMIFVLAGIIFAAVEVWKGFSIVRIEIEDAS
jgi:sterol desaturase/sphingolipid hydroxylase (fatty acid hydroxylase superfamily)